MHLMYLNTKSQLIKRVLGLQEKLSEYKRYYEHFRDGYKRVSKEISDQNEFIKCLENEVNGYKKAYNELKEKQKETKEVDFTIYQINADVWKMIRYKTFPETHKCTEECFEEHVITAIQRDYDSMNTKYKNSVESKVYFIEYWGEKIKKEYDFVVGLSLFCDKIIVHFKK